MTLRKFADFLAPSAAFLSELMRRSVGIQKTLQQCEGLSIARLCSAGSFGKKASVVTCDVDMIPFLNSTTPPFEQELKAIADYLQK